MKMCTGLPGPKGLDGLDGLKGQKGFTGTPGTIFQEFMDIFFPVCNAKTYRI